MNSQTVISNAITEINGNLRATEEKPRLTVSGSNFRPPQKISGMRGVITASVLLLLLSASYIYMMHNTSRKMNAGMNLPAPVIEKLEVKSTTGEIKMPEENPPANRISIVKPKISDSATINIYRDPTLSKILILIKDLPRLPAGQQYELWAVIKGKYQSLGLFDASENDLLILDMNKVHQADSFVVSINKTPKPVDPVSSSPETKKAF